MRDEPVRVIFRTVALVLGVITYLALAFGLGVEQVGVLEAATTAVAAAGVIAGAAEAARNRVTPYHPDEDG